MKLPYQSKPAKRTSERNVYFIDPLDPDEKPHGLCFKSINVLTWDENQFLDGQKQSIGRNRKEVTDAILTASEIVAGATGRDINDIAFALTEYRDEAASNEQPQAYLKQAGLISLHAPTEFQAFLTALGKGLENERLTRLMVVMQRAAPNPEFEFDPEKYALGDGEKLHEEYSLHLLNFFVIESRGETDYHLTPIPEIKDGWLFKYDAANYTKPPLTVKEEEEQAVARKERTKAAAGKS